MKIAYLTPSFWPHTGGVERHVARLAAQVAAAGHEVEVLTQERDASLPRVSPRGAVVVRRFATLPLPYPFAPGLWRYLHRHASQYDLLHAHSYHAFSSLPAGLAQIPLVFTPHYHGSGHTAIGRLLHLPYRLPGGWLVHRANRLIAVSQSEADLLRAHFPDADERLRVIPNGVDLAAIQQVEPLPLPGTAVLTTGRLLPYKRIDRLIAAVLALGEPYTLTVLGEGPDRRRLEALAAGSPAISFPGTVPEEQLYGFLRGASRFASLSEQEAYNISLAEALAANLPAIASDIPAHRELLPSEHLVPVQGSAASVALALARATSIPNPPLLSWEEVARRTLEVYREAAQQPA